MSRSFLNQVKGFLTDSLHMLTASFGRCLPLVILHVHVDAGRKRQGTPQLEIHMRSKLFLLLHKTSGGRSRFHKQRAARHAQNEVGAEGPILVFFFSFEHRSGSWTY